MHVRYAEATDKKCAWAYRIFNEWLVYRNNAAKVDASKVAFVRNIMEMADWELVYALKRFILEVRKKNGDVYPAETLYELIICLQMYVNSQGRSVRFLDDVDYIEVRHCLDNRMKELSRNGNVQQRKKADIITIKDENAMWEANVLGSSNPKQLVETIFYLFGVHFALRVSVEHRSLRIGTKSQLSLGLDRDKRYIEYREDVSKTRQGGLDHKNVGRKIVRAYANIAHPDRCIVTLYDTYMSRRPIHMNLDDFYLRPLAHPRGNTWYASQPIGRNSLSKIVGKLAESAGLQGNYSNHSLRATAATRLYHANVDEQLITEVTGHRSNAVRGYKCISSNQLKTVSNVLYGGDCVEKAEEKEQICKSEVFENESKECEVVTKKPKIDIDLVTGQKTYPVNVNVTVNFAK